MRNTNILKSIIIILVLFFSLKAISELAYIKGANNDPPDPGFVKLSTQIFPLLSSNYYNYGSLLMDRNGKTHKKSLEESRQMFERSIRLNNLNFSSHFLLGRTYLESNSTDPLVFEKGLRLIKNASSIRKTNLSINSDTVMIYLSLWPFIGQEDKDTAISLMKISMSKVGKEKFEKIIETWGFYSQDPSFLTSILNKTGRFYQTVHKELIKHELDLNFRHRLLAQTEYLQLKRFETEKQKYAGDETKMISLLKRSISQIKGYYKFSPGTKFRETALFNFQKELINKSVKILLSDLSTENISKIIGLSRSYINIFNSLKDIEEFDEFLKQKKFFNSNDLNVFYIKQLLNFKTGQISKMISETESFRKSVTFVKEGQEKDLAKLLTLLADAYMNSRLLTKAMDVLKDIEKISPVLISTFWRLMRIEKVIGTDDFFINIKDENFDKIKKSNIIHINKKNIKTSVYPYNIDKIILELDENYYKKFGEFHLLQVFVNGRIFHEAYIKGLKFPIELPLDDKLKKAKFEVEINSK